MEKGGTTIYLWENENKFRTSCFSKYQVFKLKKKMESPPFRMEMEMSKEFSGEFHGTNFENPRFAWEFNFISFETKFPLRKNFFPYYLLHILCSKAVAEK